MYRLKDLKNGLYQIHSKFHKQAYEGTPKSIFEMAVKMGVKEDQLKVAVNKLSENEKNNYAEFTSDGRFMCVRTNGDSK